MIMEYTKIRGLDCEASRIAIGTWAIGGWMWGGTEENDARRTLETALDMGINIIDTAPVYGLGHSEELVGQVLKDRGCRDKVILCTKVGLEWDDKGSIVRNCTKERILKEIDDSLRRLQTDYVDVYHVHWPDSLVPFEETAEVLVDIQKQGKVRVIGVSNYSPRQMNKFSQKAVISTCQPQYNIFERAIEHDVLPYCQEKGITTFLYSTLCRGLLNGKLTIDSKFSGDDLRISDPKFQPPRFKQYLAAVNKLDQFAQKNYGKSVLHLAVRWVLDQAGCDVVLWGARNPRQMEPVADMTGWSLTPDAIEEINNIVEDTVIDPISPEFLLPPHRN